MRVNWRVVREAAVAVGISVLAAAAITGNWSLRKSGGPVDLQVFALTPHTSFTSPLQVPDPDNAHEHYRLKMNPSGQLEGLLHCRMSTVEQCEWVARYL